MPDLTEEEKKILRQAYEKKKELRQRSLRQEKCLWMKLWMKICQLTNPFKDKENRPGQSQIQIQQMKHHL